MNIWVGYDTREHWAFKVCDYSIRKHRPDAIVKPIEQRNTRLLGLYDEPVDENASTEFSLTRFLTLHYQTLRDGHFIAIVTFSFWMILKNYLILLIPSMLQW